MKQIAIVMCLCCWISGNVLAQDTKLVMQLKYKDGQITVDDTVCPSAEGQQESMLQIRQGKAKASKERAYRRFADYSNQAVFFRVDVITDNIEDNIKRELSFPMVHYTSMLKEGDEEAVYGEDVSDESVVKIEIPYKENMQYVEVSKLGRIYEDKKLASFASAPLVINASEFQVVEEQFIPSAIDGMFTFRILGCGYSHTQAGLDKFREEAFTTAMFFKSQPPMDEFQVFYNYPHEMYENFYDLNCHFNEGGRMISDHSCVLCHAGAADEVIVLMDCEGVGLELGSIGANAGWECFDNFSPAQSVNTFCNVSNGKWNDDPLKYLAGALHECGHSMYGLRDERANGTTGTMFCLETNCCNSGTEGCSWNGGCGDVCKFETPTLGCVYENMGTCSDYCSMQRLNRDNEYCPRCWSLGRKHIRKIIE